MTNIQIIILGIVEGLTEYLPVSSTGHMIIASSFMGIEENIFVQNFEVIIQFGAILAVLLLYWRKFLSSWSFYKKLFVAFVPTGVLGLLLHKKIEALLGSPTVVAWSLVIGGVILILSDKWFLHLENKGKTVDEMSYLDGAKLGVVQSIAMIPGVSRSGATIIGGLGLGLNRKAAAEFSFFLAVPTLAAATLFKGYKIIGQVQASEWKALALGSVIAFIVAAIAVKLFIGIVSRYGFKWFGIYRIIVGAIILALVYSGHSLHV